MLSEKDKYDTIWDRILAYPGQLVRLHDLKASFQRVQTSLSGLPYQCKCQTSSRGLVEHTLNQNSEPFSHFAECRPWAFSSGSFGGLLPVMFGDSGGVPDEQLLCQVLGCGIPGSSDRSSPVDSLDQLYIQAAALHPILIFKVQQWAVASDGYFKVPSPPTQKTGVPPSASATGSRDNARLSNRFLAWN